MMKSLVFRANKAKSEIYKQTCLSFSKFIQDEYSTMKYWEHTNKDASGNFTQFITATGWYIPIMGKCFGHSMSIIRVFGLGEISIESNECYESTYHHSYNKFAQMSGYLYNKKQLDHNVEKQNTISNYTGK